MKLRVFHPAEAEQEYAEAARYYARISPEFGVPGELVGIRVESSDVVRVFSYPVPVHIRRVLLPHEARAAVRHRAVPVVGEATFRGAARCIGAVLPRVPKLSQGASEAKLSMS